MNGAAKTAHRLSMKVNWWVERFCVALMVVLVFDVWIGIMVRYAPQKLVQSFPFPLTFTEELARYLMIWMALLAVSSGFAHREHIGVMFVFERFPPQMKRWLALAFDIIAFGFFAYLLINGVGFVERGFGRFTMIFGVPKGYPYIGVPLAAFLACVQLVLVAIRDFLVFGQEQEAGEGA
jgi:TRAP-type C4-dicarboxylate transport system permease small subunit